ncbi:MAG: hypothetical protein ABIZ04_19185 [Opitutus sp.]
MSDQATSGEPSPAPVTATEPASPAAPSTDSKPIGSFGNARGSGLSRGKRATPPAAAASAPSASSSSYRPTSVEVITPQREYTHPFASEMPAAVPPVNEPAPQAESPLPTIAPAPATIAQEPAPAVIPAPARGSEMFPYMPTAGNEPKPGSPQPPAPANTEKAEIKILPPAEAKRPAVSWGDGTNDEDTRRQTDQRATFRPERRESKPFEPREQKPFQPRDQKPFQPREPRRDPAYQPRSAQPRDAAPSRPAETPPASGGFIGWLKGLFGGKPAEPQKSETESRDGQFRGDQNQRNRNRGGRDRGGYQGENRNRSNYQPRDPRDEPQGGAQGQGGGEQGDGQQRFEGGGGGGRRRRRGGRNRNRDDRGGPRSEGQQGGGAI